MKKHILTISLIAMLGFVGFIGFNVMKSHAESNLQSPYSDESTPLENVMVMYHKHVNDTFNDYTKRMLQGIEKDPNDKNGRAPEGDNPEEKCDSKNYSTFCLSVTLLGGKDGQMGYLNYKKALEGRRNAIFDTAEEKDAWNKWIQVSTCLGLTQSICDQKKKEALNQQSQDAYQAEKALAANARLDAINREINTSKQALDKTLAAYDELRVAWPLHKMYVQIFKDLTTYRDKIIEIRHQTDQYPSRFVDVTTTKCF